MKRTLVVALIVVLAALIGPVRAEVPRQYWTYGYGTGSCGRWITDKAENNVVNAANRAWVLGYITGVGGSGVRMRQTDSPGILSFVDQYCDAHRVDTIEVAAVALVTELRLRTPAGQRTER